MANTNFSELLVNPNFRSTPSQLGSEKPARTQPPRNRLTLLNVLSIAVFVLAGVLAYSLWRQSVQAQAFKDELVAVHQSQELVVRRLDGNGDEIASLQSRQEVTMERVGVTQRDLKRAQALAGQLKEEQARSVAALSQEIAQKADTQQVASLKEESGQKFEGVNQEISTVKDSVANNQQELTQTLEKLTKLGVRVTEQGNMIATTSVGLDELRRRGEREYVTFDFKKKRRTKVAGIGLELRKANPKDQRANLRIFIDDREMERKHININTPVNFYVGSQRIAYELIINKVLKDRITGYVSVPKGKLPQGSPSSDSPAFVSFLTFSQQTQNS